MTFMKKITAVFLALLLPLGALFFAPTAAAADTTASDFVPVFRFIASSDTHVRDDNDVNAQRITKMLQMAYDMADSDESYNGLDAFLVAGDLTNDGTTTEFDKFWNAVSGSLREGTQFLGVVAKNHDGYAMKRTEMRDYYTGVSQRDADFHVVINGYHFIGLSASKNGAFHYDPAQLIWLRQQLDAAKADAADRPVFVMHHEHNKGTVYGSSQYEGWGVPYFNEILNQYPQVVDFSGHSHYPLNDPRSVWQGKYTAIGTGAIYYSEFTIGTTRTYHPEDSNETATCWIVELDAENRIRLRGMDILANACLCEYVLDNPANPANRPFTPAKRRAASKAPVFDENAALTVTPGFGTCKITAPAAQSADGMPIVLYRGYAKNSCGGLIAKSWTLPKYYLATQQNEIELELEGLSEGEYTVCVVAETAYGVQSLPLEAKVAVTGENAFVGFFLRIGIMFRHLIDAIKSLF